MLAALIQGAFAAVGYGVWWVLDDLLGRAALGQIVSLGAALTVGGTAYLLVCMLLRVRELDALRSLRSRATLPGR